MIQSIASHASATARTEAIDNASIAVTKKVQDQTKAEGEAAVGLIDAAGTIAKQAPPTGDHTGQHVNFRV